MKLFRGSLLALACSALLFPQPPPVQPRIEIIQDLHLGELLIEDSGGSVVLTERNELQQFSGSVRPGRASRASMAPCEKPRTTVFSAAIPSSARRAVTKSLRSSRASATPACDCASEEPSIQGIGNHCRPKAARAKASGASGAMKTVSGR